MKEMKEIIIRYVCMSVARTRMEIYATSTCDTSKHSNSDCDGERLGLY